MLGELGIGRGEACELLRSGGGAAYLKSGESGNMGGGRLTHNTHSGLGPGEILKELVGDVCLPVWLHPADAVFCFRLVFLQKVRHTARANFV